MSDMSDADIFLDRVEAGEPPAIVVASIPGEQREEVYYTLCAHYALVSERLEAADALTDVLMATPEVRATLSANRGDRALVAVVSAIAANRRALDPKLYAGLEAALVAEHARHPHVASLTRAVRLEAAHLMGDSYRGMIPGGESEVAYLAAVRAGQEDPEPVWSTGPPFVGADWP